MATIIKVAGADFSANAVGFLAPVTSGLVGWWHLGGTIEKSRRNLATGSNSTVVGVPTIAATYASFSPTAYLDTGLSETDEFTFICAVKNPAPGTAAANKPIFMGNYTGTGCGLFDNGGTAPAGSVYGIHFVDNGAGGSVQSRPTTTDTDVTAWHYCHMSVSATNTYVANKTRNVTANAAFSTARKKIAGLLRVGTGNNAASFAGTPDMAFAAIYNRALTGAEEATVYAFVKSLMAQRSITV